MTQAVPTLPPSVAAEGNWRAEFVAMAKLSWPLALANLLQMLTYAVDVIFIARLGEAQLAASALAVAVFGLVLWALTGLTGAVAPVIAAALGARAPALRPVRRATRMALWLAVLSGAGGMLICLLLGPLAARNGAGCRNRRARQRIQCRHRLVDDPDGDGGRFAQLRIGAGPPDLRHRDHGGGDRGQRAGELCLHLRQSGRAGTGADGGGRSPRSSLRW